ncbi:MAG: DUF2254 domain-containing protein [Acidimicrobiales bacterium]
MIVRLRQIFEELHHRILFIPLLCVVFAVALSQLSLWIDRQLDDEGLPRILETTVESGRAILAAIAGGLITSITLLLSMMLVAVQLASSQFSPRTARDWLGDRTQQLAIGLVLGAAVFSLLALREVRSFDGGDELTPHFTVLASLAFGVGALVAVVYSVDRLAHSLRIGAVARRVARETVAALPAGHPIEPLERPDIAPAMRTAGTSDRMEIPDRAGPIEARRSGWIQQIDLDVLIDALPPDTTAWLTSSIGEFVLERSPLLWLDPAPDGDGQAAIHEAFAVGDTRTMQQDVGYGIVRLTDIAVRALSPGVNDPNTANDVVVHLGVVISAIWERPLGDRVIERDGRRVHRSQLDYADYLHAAFDPLRRYGCGDATVARTMARTLRALATETTRRDLPGPVKPLEDMLGAVVADALTASNLAERDRTVLASLVSSASARQGPTGSTPI